MRVLKAAWPVLCAFLCGFLLHALIERPRDSAITATSITMWVAPFVLGLEAVAGVRRSLRAASPSRDSR